MKAKIGRDELVWFLHVEGGDEGPLSLNQLVERYQAGALQKECLISRQRSNGDWVETSLGKLMERTKAHRKRRRHRATPAFKVHLGRLNARWRAALFSAATLLCLLLVILFFLRSCGSTPSDAEVERALSSSGVAQPVSPSFAPLVRPATGWTRLFPNCGPVIHNGVMLARQGAVRAIFPNILVERQDRPCPTCPLRARMADGTALVLRARDDVARRLVAGGRGSTHLCGELVVRHAGAAWIDVSEVAH
jgi:hypothetical protein